MKKVFHKTDESSRYPLSLRPATLKDLALLRHWDEQPHVIAADPNDDWQWESELGKGYPWREQLMAEITIDEVTSQKIDIGYVEIIDPQLEKDHYWGAFEKVGANLRAIDIWIGEVEYLRKGYGSKMMELALERCFACFEVVAVLVDPLANNYGAHRFYEGFGFQFKEARRFGCDDCWVYRLERNRWEK